MSDQDKPSTIKAILLPNFKHMSDSDALMESHISSGRRGGMFQQSWSVYRQITASLRPKTLSCLSTGSQVVEESSGGSRNTLDKLRERFSADDEVQQFVDNETFMERLTRTFTFDPYTGITEQRANLESASRSIILTCAVFGALHGVVEGRQEFKELSKTTMFASKLTVHKRKTNTIVKTAIEKGTKLCFKGSGVILSVLGISSLIEIYMNKSTAWSYAVAYGVCGGLIRINVGPKAMGATAIIGSVIGFVVGGIALGVRRASGKTQEQLNFEACKEYIAERKHLENSMKLDVSSKDDVDEAD